jgi:hypothetical protein
MSSNALSPLERLAALRDRFHARAAGWWRVSGDHLEQVAFAAADLPEEVAREFSEATRSVPLDRVDLGVVKAAVTGEVTVSRVGDVLADTGSGHWLRRFGASRSVAVPIHDTSGIVARVVSLALPEGAPDDEAVAVAIRSAAMFRDLDEE